MLNLRLLLVIFLHLGSIVCFGQQARDTVINEHFENVKLPDLFTRLERKIPFKFYYDAAQLDSFQVQFTAKNLTLEQVLQLAFKGTDIRYSIDNLSGYIYVTRKLTLVTELPKGYFNSKNLAGETKNGDSMTLMNEFNIEVETAKISTVKTVEIGNRNQQVKEDVTLIGYIRNSRTGAPVTGASVVIDSLYSDNTDLDGLYSITLPAGKYSFSVSMIGMKDTRVQLYLYSKGRFDIDMEEQIRTLKEVVVSSQRTQNVRSVQMGVQRLTIENIQRMPTLFGETDVLRAVISLPGVKTVGEASTGFNVRGGSSDQNLILFNEATIFNPSHFFGLFSAFNPDIVKSIELYKSSVPAKFGGRLSSVLDIAANEGNKKKIRGSAGIGPVTGRIHLEGPLVKDKTSFNLGARTTYANWLLNLLPSEYKNSKASFQDINLIIDHRADSNNHFSLNTYFSNDKFSLADDTVYQYSNKNINLKWRRQFTRKFSGSLIAGFDQYSYSTSSDANQVNAFKLGFDISQFFGRAAFDLFLNPKHSLDFGVNAIRYKLNPGFIKPNAVQSVVSEDKVKAEQAWENGIYLTHRFNINSQLSLSSGLRYSFFQYLGAQDVRIYNPGQPITTSNLVETKQYEKGEIIKTYSGPEVRLSARYAFSNMFSIKAAYNSLRQYLHLMSNTAIIAPTDIWKMSDANINPQKGQQISIGVYNNFRSNSIETSVEVYYKKIKDYLDYKPGATLFLNHSVETEVINTRGKAYGVEVMLKKTAGKLTGWVSYTYSRILLQANDTTQGVLVNRGNYYPANYDKPHDVTLTGNFKVNHRFSLSLNTTYSTGRPITLPIGRYYYAGSQRVLYSDRNAYRIPDYFRIDMSMNLDGNHKINQRTHNSWTFGIYNLLGRKNPYSVYYVSENGQVNGYKLSIFGSAIPFVTFNIAF